MKNITSLSELSNEVQKGGATPQLRAGTFVQGIAELVNSAKNDPSRLTEIVNELREQSNQFGEAIANGHGRSG